MSVHHVSSRPRALRGGALLALCLVATACTADAKPGSAGEDGTGATPAAAASEPVEPQASVTASIEDGAKDVPVSETFSLTARDGVLQKVRVLTGRGGKKDRLRGRLLQDGARWKATERLEPGRHYRVSSVAVDDNGLTTRTTSTFRTDDLTLDEQTFPSIAPLDGETVGVGMPVLVQFDVPVTDRAAIEKHLSVESSPQQRGAWHWVSDNEVRWRPKSYWKPGTEVTVNADINSIPAGKGVYGQLSRSTSFTVGDSVISKVDIAAHTMSTYINGDLARTVPISAGKPGFQTRSGTKVIMEKFREKRMDAATTGISEDDPEYYNISDVEYAMRLTYSGEFLHAAPWSAGSQGAENVSHGCVGMSTEDARWLYERTTRGDVVEVTGSDRHMTLYNGFGDWNTSFKEYRQGSAL